MAEKNEMNTTMSFHPVVTKRACEAIYEQVKDLISKGELKPGDRLPSERNMMEIFQRSRPTIREALRMLERSGYIRTIAGSNGAVVLEPNTKNVEQIMQDAIQVGHIQLNELNEYRRVSELATVAWAAERRTEEDVVALKAQLEKMKAVVEDYEAFVDMDPQLHGLLAAAAKNEMSIIMNRTISKIKQEYFKQKLADMSPASRKRICRKVQAQHEAVCAAVITGNVEEARLQMEKHLQAYEEDLF